MFCENCGFENKDTAKFCKKCGANLGNEIKDENGKKEVNSAKEMLESEFDSEYDNMKLSKKQLLEYLNLGKELEINKLGLENGIKDLQKLDKKKYQEIVRPLSKNQKPNFKIFKENPFQHIYTLACVIGIPIYILSVFLSYKYYDAFFSKYFAWDTPREIIAVPVSLIINLVCSLTFSICQFIIHNTLGRQKYISKVRKYKKECDEIDINNNQQLVTYNEKKDVIFKRIDNINKDLDDVEKTLNNYYDVGVIYPKYRNLIAITTFIEYLESGRCKSLYGYTGCYNVYEQEIRQNAIISKLDQVLIQLEQIKKIQFATYLAIAQSNALQSALLNTCNDMLEESKKEGAILEAQAQDEKIIKRNSEIVSTIATLDYINR
jgi:hypothetical protein